MNPFLPPFLAVFFSIFHLLGGGAIGQGIRAARQGSDDQMFFFVWGAVMGGVPLLFDWFFLVAQGQLAFGLIGPFVFLVAILASAFLELEIEGSAAISAALGSGAFLIGLFAIPLMLDAAKTAEPGFTDYVFGSCFVLMFIVIGGSIAWNGFSAIIRGISLGAKSSEPEKTEHPGTHTGKRNMGRVDDQNKSL